MKVQRAPRSSAQPQRPPADRLPSRVADPAPAPAPAPTATASHSLFSAGVDLDLTGPLRRSDEPGVVAEIVANLVFACRHEGVAGDRTAIRLLRPTADGLVGVVLQPGEDQSVHAVRKALTARALDLPSATADMVTVVLAGATRARPTGDWGLGGACVATLGPVVPTIVSHRLPGDSSLGLAERLLARLDLTMNDAGLSAHRVVRVLDVLARAVEGPDR